VREDFAEKMRMCGWNESRTADDLTRVDRQYVSGILIVELIAFEPVGALELLPISLNYVNFVTQSKVHQQLRLVKVPIGACDHMNHALALANVSTAEQKHVCWIRRLSELPVDRLKFRPTEGL
jgi:hypothetical protein